MLSKIFNQTMRLMMYVFNHLDSHENIHSDAICVVTFLLFIVTLVICFTPFALTPKASKPSFTLFLIFNLLFISVSFPVIFQRLHFLWSVGQKVPLVCYKAPKRRVSLYWPPFHIAPHGHITIR